MEFNFMSMHPEPVETQKLTRSTDISSRVPNTPPAFRSASAWSKNPDEALSAINRRDPGCPHMKCKWIAF